MALRDDTSKWVLPYITWDWQNVEDLYDVLIPKVAPGVALRAYRDSYDRRPKPSVEDLTHPLKSIPRPLSQDRQIRSGARQILNEVLERLVKQGYIHKRKVDGNRQVRLKERIFANPYKVQATEDLVAAVEKYLQAPLFVGLETSEERTLRRALDKYKEAMDD
jgi:hypothetical protein